MRALFCSRTFFLTAFSWHSSVRAEVLDTLCFCLEQSLVREAISFMWALVDYNARMLSAIITMNVEDPTAVGPSTGNSRNWSAILVSLSHSHLAGKPMCIPLQGLSRGL